MHTVIWPFPLDRGQAVDMFPISLVFGRTVCNSAWTVSRHNLSQFAYLDFGMLFNSISQTGICFWPVTCCFSQ